MRDRRTSPGGGAARFAGPALAVLLAGCGGPDRGYDPALRYPPRADALVIDTPRTPPADRHPAGKLDEWTAGLGRDGGLVLDPAAASPAERAAVAAAVDDLFGTPAAPKVGGHEAALGLDPARLTAGAALYKHHCVQCHGLSGDGRGPTSLFVTTPARDFRRGRFKFVSATANGVPTRDDLARTIRRGVDGNSMPPFELLPESEIAELVDYTIHLSLRGEAEFAALKAVLGPDGEGDVAAVCRAELDRAVGRWAEAAAKAVTPAVPAGVEPPAGDRVRRGHGLFAGAAGCLSCHRDYGRADHLLYDLWGVAVRPADLTLGRYKSGGEPVELFRRVRCGIAPSGMPAAALTDDQTWDVVAFLRALPTPRLLPDDVRAAVYPNAR
jgi:mono/diheme cytochrome c family protein